MLAVVASSEMEIMAHVDPMEHGTWLLKGAECVVLGIRALICTRDSASRNN